MKVRLWNNFFEDFITVENVKHIYNGVGAIELELEDTVISYPKPTYEVNFVHA